MKTLIDILRIAVLLVGSVIAFMLPDLIAGITIMAISLVVYIVVTIMRYAGEKVV